MPQSELAEWLIAAGEAERTAFLQQHNDHLNLELAYHLKDICHHSWASDPTRTVVAANTLGAMVEYLPQAQVRALADWTAGIAALTMGEMETALARLDRAIASFEAQGRPHTAAATQVSKVIALAMTGKYDDAIACGLAALDVFIDADDELAAGKIEQNLGNLYFRRDRYTEAAQLYSRARERFVAVGDTKQLAQIDVCLAVTMAAQNRFREAAQLYETALARAESAGLEVTRAEIECNLGCLALFRGQFDGALAYLESSRRRYLALGMPHESAVADLELADAYLELNLAPEAAAIYTRVAPAFGEMRMQAELARALANLGRAKLHVGQYAAARTALSEASALYAVEGNRVGEALVTLTEGHLYFVEGDFRASMDAAMRAEPAFAEAGTWGRLLEARWLQGEAARALGATKTARSLLEAALFDAELQAMPQIAQRCHTSLGQLLADAGSTTLAEDAFKRAIAIIEELGAPLPAEEFRIAFIADKLTPYTELARLCLNDGRPERVVEALDYVERARSRVLLDILGGALVAPMKPENPYEAALLARLEALREELNWYYSQINHPRDQSGARGTTLLAALHASVAEREAEVLEITRHLNLRGGGAFLRVEPLDQRYLRNTLGSETALIEYFTLNDELLAFVVTNEGVNVVRHLGSQADAERLIDQLRFQLDTLRHNPAALSRHLEQLTVRACQYLSALYDLLLRPLEWLYGTRRLVIVPQRMLHYVPFHALHDGRQYVIEQREVAYTPSAGVLRHCFAQPVRALKRALLLGVPDLATPRVRDEVTRLAQLFPEAETLLDAQATWQALQTHAPRADLVHLACHGQFRPDNPLFSALRLADGWLTVRYAYDLDLSGCRLLVLSACETGLNALAPGDDLIGLARGFFAAGSPSLVVSLWNVDDATTAQLMEEFYARLHAGAGIAAALRAAQCCLMKRNPHPFFWSPFVLLGRW